MKILAVAFIHIICVVLIVFDCECEYNPLLLLHIISVVLFVFSCDSEYNHVIKSNNSKEYLLKFVSAPY